MYNGEKNRWGQTRKFLSCSIRKFLNCPNIKLIGPREKWQNGIFPLGIKFLRAPDFNSERTTKALSSSSKMPLPQSRQ